MSQRRHHSIALFALATAVVVVGPVATASAVTRYATPPRFAKPAGGAPCTDPAKPCLLVTALAQAGFGDEVELRPGNYWKTPFNPGISDTEPFDDTVTVPANVTLRGANQTDMPVIHVKPNAQAEAGLDLSAGAKLRDLAVSGSAANDTLFVYSLRVGSGAVAERVRVQTTGAPGAVQTACSLLDGATLRNAVCLGRGATTDGPVTAVSATTNTATYTVRNVTAVSTATNSYGFQFGASNGTAAALVSNSIFRGTAADVRVRAGLAGGQASAVVDHSNWNTSDVSAQTGALATLVDAGGNQNAATAATPLFFDQAAGDFRQVAGSPTIDAGVSAPTNNGPLALGGQNRLLGSTTDIGAYEFDPGAPPVGPLPTTPETTDPDPTTPEPTTPEPTNSTPTPDPTPTGGTPLTQAADRQAPTLTGFTLARTVKRTKGTAISFTLSEPASVALAFGQPKTGRTVGGKCRPQTAKNRKQKRCTIANVKGTLTIAGKAGANTLSFKGALTARKRLALGSYTVTATPTDAAGNRGTPASRRFKLSR